MEGKERYIFPFFAPPTISKLYNFNNTSTRVPLTRIYGPSAYSTHVRPPVTNRITLLNLDKSYNSNYFHHSVYLISFPTWKFYIQYEYNKSYDRREELLFIFFEVTRYACDKMNVEKECRTLLIETLCYSNGKSGLRFRSLITWWTATETRGRITSRSIGRPGRSSRRWCSIERSKERTRWKWRPGTAHLPPGPTATASRIPVWKYIPWYISPHAFDPLLSSIASKILSFENSNIREIRVATNLEIFCSSGWKNILLRVEIKVEARVFLPRRKGWGFRWCRCWESIALLMLSGGKVNRDFLSRPCKI